MVWKKMKSLDYFSSNFNLSFKKREYYQSKTGGIVTVLTIFLFIGFAIYLGKELVYKENPNDIQTTLLTIPPNISFLVPVAFLVQYSSGSTFYNQSKLITVNATYYSLYNDNQGIFITNESVALKMRNCVMTDFSPELSESYKLMTLNDADCFDNKKLELGGDFSSNYVKFVEVEITPCVNTSKSSECSSLETQMEIFSQKNIEVALHHESLTYNSESFHDPIKKILMEDNYLIDYNVCKIYFYYMHQFIIYSEDGFIFTSYRTNIYYEFEHIKTDFIINPPDLSKSCLVKFVFQSSFYTRIQTRNYLTFSSVIAQVGGALNAYLILFLTIFRAIYRRKMNEKIIRELFTDHKIRNEQLVNIPQEEEKTNNKRKITSQILVNHKRKTSLDLEINKLKSMKVEVLSSKTNRETSNQQTDENFHLESTENHKMKINTDNKLRLIKRYETVRKNSLLNSSEQRYVSRIKFSLIQHFFIHYCYCCVGKKLKKMNFIYEELQNFSFRYLDIVNLVKKLHEFERLKFVLFDKSQLAFFNCISQPSNPLIKDKNTMNIIAERLIFDNDLVAQKNIIDEVMKKNQDFLNNKVNIRLFKFYLNIID